MVQEEGRIVKASAQQHFGALRSLLSRLAAGEESEVDLLELLSEVEASDNVLFAEQWIPYLAQQEILTQVSLSAIHSIGELEDLVERFPFALFSMDVSYLWHRHGWFVDLARCREMTRVRSCILCGNDFGDEDAELLANCRKLDNLRHLDVRGTFLSAAGIELLETSEYLDPSCNILAEPFDEDSWQPPHLQRMESPADSDFAEFGVRNLGLEETVFQSIISHLPEILREVEQEVSEYVTAMGSRSFDEFPCLFRLSGTYYIENIEIHENAEAWIHCHILERWRDDVQGYLGLEFCWTIDPHDEPLITKRLTNSSAI